jgi:hypothetical protein
MEVFMFVKAILFPSTKRSFSLPKPAALFHISIFIFIAILLGLFSTNANAAQVKVILDPSPDSRAIGHKLYYCQSSNMSKTNFTEKIDLGTKTYYVTPQLQKGATYYFAATAYDKYGNESVFSEVISYKVPEKGDEGNKPDSVYLMEDFEKYAAGSNPSNWFNTKDNNSMVEDTNLFKVYSINNNKVFGTTSTLTNIHSHHLKSYIEKLSSAEYTGRMMMTDPTSGIGVTFLSHYPFTDTYYRLRCDRWNSFRLAPHPHNTAKVFGITDTGVIAKANQWYKFRIKIQDTGARTEILAKVWPENTSEPSKWQIDAYDNTSNRVSSGTFGVWSGWAGNKYWDDLTVLISN